MLLFERQEYLARVARVKEAMVKRGIDLLLVASPANQFWLTGYDGWSFYTPQMVAVSTRQEEPIWIGRKMDAVGAKFTAFLDDSLSCHIRTNTSRRATFIRFNSWLTKSRDGVGTREASASKRMTIIIRPSGTLFFARAFPTANS
jgi:Xaa-Pro aminopeptidase